MPKLDPRKVYLTSSYKMQEDEEELEEEEKLEEEEEDIPEHYIVDPDNLDEEPA